MKSKSIDELKRIAVDLAENRLFCNLFIDEQDISLLPSIFLPLGLGGLSHLSKDEVDNIGLIYEYYSEAANRSINGYPIFTSVKFLNKDDLLTVKSICESYMKMRDSFLQTAPPLQLLDETNGTNSALIPNEHLENICLMGQGEKTCIYLGLTKEGFTCLKNSRIKDAIAEKAKEMVSNSINCDGL